LANLDGAISSDPAVQRQLDRLNALSLPQGRIGLDAMRVLMERLGHPEKTLPPILHIAGTNGKGSTAAFLRAMLEADDKRVHVYTSPHLVRFNERIRLGGSLIEDALLAELLEEVLDQAGDLGASFFEVTTAAAFLAFSRTPAEGCVIEVGLGGRLDATNVVPAPAVCGIAALGIDHEAFLLSEEPGSPPDPMTRIAWEKAGIAKTGTPLVTQLYAPDMMEAIGTVAERTGAPLFRRGADWTAEVREGRLRYRDAAGMLDLPLPNLPGGHQADNAALAAAMLRHQQSLTIADSAIARGITAAHWPARLQRLQPGPLANLLPDTRIWLDGGHNPNAGEALGDFFKTRGAPMPIVIGMLANKNPDALLAHLRPTAIVALPVPGHESHPASAFGGYPVPVTEAADIESALRLFIADPPEELLIAGSLYLAGDVLRQNEQAPS